MPRPSAAPAAVGASTAPAAPWEPSARAASTGPRAGPRAHPVQQRAQRLEASFRRGGAGLEVVADERSVLEHEALGGQLAAAQVRRAGGEGVLAGVDGEQDSGLRAQGEAAGGTASRGGAVALGGGLLEPSGLLELGAHAEHGGAGEPGGGHRVGRGEGLGAEGVLEERLTVRPAHQLRRADPAVRGPHLSDLRLLPGSWRC